MTGDPPDWSAWRPRRVPILTATALTATLLGTLTRLLGPGVFHALRRDATDLGHWQIWRLVSPVLVQGDQSPLAIIGVFVVCAVIGVADELLLPRSEWLVLSLLGALFAALIPLSILDTALRDIHGAPFLLGLAVGSSFELRRRATTKDNRAA